MTPDNIKNIPEKPGIYFFLNKTGKIIYIGKAKNLKKRVNSYWLRVNDLTEAKQNMLSEITKIQYTIVDSELESLLLEAGQIKKHQPKYNIVLKDDKNWGYIVITEQAFPRIVVSHGREKLKGQHFGPYTSTLAAKNIVRLLHRILPLRTCLRDLKTVPKGKVCLQYHLGLCDGPCEKFISENQYQKLIKEAVKIIKGETKDLEKKLLAEISQASAAKQFELAAKKKNQILALKRLQEKQKIVSTKNINQDLINFSIFQKQVIISLLQVRRGTVGDKFNFIVDNKLDLKIKEILESTLQQFYSQSSDLPKEIISPIKVDIKNILINSQIQNIVPQKGKNKKLLELLKLNTEDYLQKNLNNSKLEILIQLQKTLKLKNLPKRIEVYDISNIQGNFSYGSMIVFIDGKIAADQYRIFKIKNIVGPDDFASLKQVLERRQKHPEWPSPDLIILDGGKGQLNTVYPSLKKSWQKKVISLAKREEEIFIPGKKQSLQIDQNSKLSLFIQNMRNQAHKFGIKHYRQAHRRNLKNSKNQ
ncbi:excinuclease ABC subunit UvrC [Candidatus Nomurabacteria bacterium]|nr:excinuclease ABC subunit UvrC [Candidatus Nomurabacteria bacterium]